MSVEDLPKHRDDSFYSAYYHRDRLIHIVDADLKTCESLSVLFRLEGFQTAFSINVAGFLASLERRRPDVVITNCELSGEDGLALLHRVKLRHIGTPVFVIQNEPQVERAVAAMKAGATDVLTMPIDNEHLLQLVRITLRRDVHIGAVQNGRRTIEVRGFAQLTDREREVLQLITDGRSNKEAGRHLGISPRTIEVHRARVMEKLGARNTADLMRIVLTS